MSSLQNNTSDDNWIDEDIKSYVDPQNLRSFFLFAGAGSGKTRTLKNALEHILERDGERLLRDGKRVGVVTYTNGAVDEIKGRIKDNALFEVSTIHSFAWELVKGFNADIREWFRASLKTDIAKLESAELKGRAGTKASTERLFKIKSKSEKLESLDEVLKFNYNPNGDNGGRGSLNHQEVIDISSDFLVSKPLLGSLLVSRFPVLLIDESQDTLKTLINSLLTVADIHSGTFSLGLIGDMMQRVYGQGKTDIETSISEGWAKPAKKLNHRCPKRVVTLINHIRSACDDKHLQEHRSDAIDGVVRAFIVQRADPNYIDIENDIKTQMRDTTLDDEWTTKSGCKSLVLEHHMASKRLSFDGIFDPIYGIKNKITILLDGTYPPLRFFTDRVLPLVQAIKRDDNFKVVQILKKHSPLLSLEALKEGQDNSPLETANKAVKLLERILKNPDVTCGKILALISRKKLFDLPDSLSAVVSICSNGGVDDENDPPSEEMQALLSVMEAPFSEVKSYKDYVDGVAEFDTHQGVKGQQFERVLAIIDDGAARGFLFKYGKVFGDIALSATDKANIEEGKDNAVHRSLRLLYVICSRAKKSLAIVVYSDSAVAVKGTLVANGWFEESEIVLV